MGASTNVTAWQLNPELTLEQASGEWIVLDANAGVVLRASGPAAHVLDAITAPGTATNGTKRLLAEGFAFDGSR